MKLLTTLHHHRRRREVKRKYKLAAEKELLAINEQAEKIKDVWINGDTPVVSFKAHQHQGDKVYHGKAFLEAANIEVSREWVVVYLTISTLLVGSDACT